MSKIQQALCNRSVNGMITQEKALEVARYYDELLAESVAIVKAFQKETGMIWGERIGVYLGDVTGTHFSSVAYNYEKPVGEQ